MKENFWDLEHEKKPFKYLTVILKRKTEVRSLNFVKINKFRKF